MSTAITFPRDNDLSGLRLEQTVNGNVATPWFSFDWKSEGLMGPADVRSKYHDIMHQSIAAFSALLNIRKMDVMVTQKMDPSDVMNVYWWRLSTRHPHELPKPKVAPKPVLPENRGAIDI